MLVPSLDPASAHALFIGRADKTYSFERIRAQNAPSIVFALGVRADFSLLPIMLGF
jgi:hypothetical protein